jgi:hypothetical protein
MWTRRSRALIVFPIVFCLGVAATLVWQSYGKTGLESVGNFFPQLAWLTPEAAAPVQSAPQGVAPSGPRYDSPGFEQLKAIALGLAALRQSVDQLTAGQEQMANEVAKLGATQRDILDENTSALSPRSPVTPASNERPATAARASSTPPASKQPAPVPSRPPSTASAR